jgi:RHS repeat-associated protein
VRRQCPLYNGNISSIAQNNRALNNAANVGSPLLFYNYKYDQLNRLVAMDAYKKTSLSANDWAGLTVMPYFKERIAYDTNGNILKYLRNGHKAANLMDSLTYWYNSGTNQLNWVRDQVPAATYGTAAGDVADIDNQSANNYGYDETGNLIKDNAEGITGIKWSVYGKILQIDKTAFANNPVTRINYSYDAQGNRVSKMVQKNNGINTYTWYVRDAQGNVLTTYSSSGSATDLSALPLQLTERHLYGSSRLGIYTATLNVDNGPKDMSDSNGTKYFRGYREYELTNHLGNVLATISDKKKPVYVSGLVSYYDADVTTAQDYYPFGMQMPGRIGYQTQGGWVSAPGSGSDNSVPADITISNRTNNLPPEYTASSSIELTPGFESGTGDVFNAYIAAAFPGGAGSGADGSSLNGAYRYGFNGKENDNEVKGTGNQQDYGMRIYDPRLGRFLSVDPLASKYPDVSSYTAMDNNPILKVDPDGKDWIVSTTKNKDGSYTTHLKLLVAVQNSSSNKNINMTSFANALRNQVKRSYGIAYTKTEYEAVTMKSGLDNYSSKTLLVPRDVKVNVVVDVQIRVVGSEKDLKSNEHLVQIQEASKLPGVYGRANDIGGTKVLINESKALNMMNGNDNNTLVHELGHTFGLRHIDQKSETFFETFLWGSNPQYYSPQKQKANTNNAMFSGGSSYMNDKTSTDINGEQIEIGKQKIKNGDINNH